MREYAINVYDDGITVRDSRGYTPKTISIYGEVESTELTVDLPSDWTGSFYLDWFYDGVWNEGETAYTDTEITAYPPEMPVGDVYFRVRREDGDLIQLSEKLEFRVKLA